MADPPDDHVGRKRGRWATISLALVIDPRISAEPKLVAAMLGAYADRTGHCYPSLGTIAARLGLHRRTVQRHLRTLEAGGYIMTWRRPRIDGRGGSASNGYLLLFPPVLDNHGATPDVAPESDDRATPDVAPPHPNSASYRREGDDQGLTDTETQGSVRRLETGGATFGDTSGATPGVAQTIPLNITQSEPAQSSRAKDGFPEETGDLPADVRKSAMAELQARQNALARHIGAMPGMTGALAWQFMIEAGPELGDGIAPSRLERLVGNWLEEQR